ncbi:hypothetical protein B0H13DRAFT_2362900 [Mycena leptocephala]|nr:hypothetical protein B0H13DRAFT_2362900 [Mycena leptocephala]
MTDHTYHSAPAASNVAGAASGFPSLSPGPPPSSQAPPPFQATMSTTVSAATPDQDLDNALIEMNDAVDSMAAATTAFFQAADRVNAGVAAVRGSQSNVAPFVASHAQIYSAGPWIAGSLYDVVPAAPLRAIPDNGEKWYAITRGKYVGLTKNSVVSLNAVTGISTSLSEKHGSQSEALDHFNSALGINAIAVIH